MELTGWSRGGHGVVTGWSRSGDGRGDPRASAPTRLIPSSGEDERVQLGTAAAGAAAAPPTGMCAGYHPPPPPEFIVSFAYCGHI